FSGRVALVTGGARGIGAATAELLAEGGAAIVVADLDAGAAEETARTIGSKHNVRALGVACDVSDPAQVDAMIAKAEDSLGAVDILVNNAGVTRDNLVHKMTEADWDLVMGVHLR